MSKAKTATEEAVADEDRAIEGRRDHLYQAAMFDPLTAGTLPPDKIVEMCDELIAVHGFVQDGGVLPPLR